MEQEIQSIQKFYNIIIEFFVNYSFQIIGAIIIFAIGWFLANKISEAVRRLCEKK